MSTPDSSMINPIGTIEKISNINGKIISRLVTAGNNLLEKAHSNGSKSLNSEVEALEYNTLIKASLNCFMIVLERYKSSLSSIQEAHLLLKVAEILLNETSSLDLAAEVCNKGLNICSRTVNSDFRLKLRLQLLTFQIHYAGDKNKLKKSSLNYLESIIEESKCLKNIELNTLLEYTKLQYFGMTYDPDQRFEILKNLEENLKNNINANNFALYQLILIYDIQQQLSKRSSVRSALSKLNLLIEAQRSYPDLYAQLPPQFPSITKHLDLLVSIQNDEFSSSKTKISRIDMWIKNLKKNKGSWHSKTFKFNINISIDGLMVPIKIDWLSMKEYIITSYFYCGVSYVVKSWDGTNRTHKIFKLCRGFIDEELSNSRTVISSIEMENKVLRLRYFRVIIDFYQVLVDFQSNNWNLFNSESYPQLFQFINDYDAGLFSSQELVVYHKLITKIYYLFALKYQHFSNYKLAKYYYIKIRRFHSSIANEYSGGSFFNDEILVTFKQESIGLGGSKSESKDCFNHLYYLSCFNLCIINLMDIKNLKSNQISEFDPRYKNYMDEFEEALSLKRTLSDELDTMLGLYKDDHVLYYTIKCIRFIVNNYESLSSLSSSSTLPSNQKFEDHLEVPSEAMDNILVVSPMLGALIYYIQALVYEPNDGMDDLTNLDNKIQLFNKSYKIALKFTPSETLQTSPNFIAYFSTKSIVDLLLKNEQLIDAERLDAMVVQLHDLENNIEGNHSEEQTTLDSESTHFDTVLQKSSGTTVDDVSMDDEDPAKDRKRKASEL
ncbi:hypothetical protein CANARDRAFT_27095 [[Candida] arabinofermentans NRRL YB-2248]|uniref:Uncharacterized protein n=1 Tax=[Candida] arabinofermentans NRRL YB-2248 TaxID=983967 RepID=A0A1E4T4L2_9ASCO|nr:hypothetical protein CANARDRAFT_27095 [[Candida] arabinofermentans NRRL YB-2248]